MGSILSGPKPQPQPQPVVYYVPQPAPEPVYTPPPASAAPAPAPVAPAPAENAAPDDAEKSKTRSQNLLKQQRGRLGTILTSAKGLLSDTVNSSGRKNLLGE